MKLYYCRINEWNNLDGASLLGTLRRQQIAKYQHPKDKLRCLVGGLMLRYAFGDDYESRLKTGSHGKLYFENASTHFNLSHSGDYVVLALAKSPVGIDVEEIGTYAPAIPKKCFTLPEQNWLASHDIPERFYQLWTAKESIMKAVGLGFTMPPASFDVLPIKDGAHAIDGQVWYMRWFALDTYQVCVSAAQDEDYSLLPLTKVDLL